MGAPGIPLVTPLAALVVCPHQPPNLYLLARVGLVVVALVAQGGDSSSVLAGGALGGETDGKAVSRQDWEDKQMSKRKPCPGCERPRSVCWIMPCLYLELVLARGRRAVKRWAQAGGGHVTEGGNHG